MAYRFVQRFYMPALVFKGSKIDLSIAYDTLTIYFHRDTLQQVKCHILESDGDQEQDLESNERRKSWKFVESLDENATAALDEIIENKQELLPASKFILTSDALHAYC